jgi:PAS domain S-box-containing protein
MNPSPLHALAPKDFGPLLTRLLAIADDAVIVTDAQHRIVLFNEGAERVFGYRLDQVLSEPLAMLLPESARATHADHLEAFALSPMAARRMGERREVHGRRADGSLFDAEASISHVDLDGKMFFTAILRDVTASRQATRSLARSEARFRELAATAPVGIFQTDSRGQFLYVNERWCDMAGMNLVEAAGIGWLRAVHPADRGPVQQAWHASVEARKPFELEYRFLRPDGNETWVMGRAVHSLGPDGNILGSLGTVTDVTESHHQALALERAKSEAETAARAKSLFLANMSHEIRTPLNAVIGMTTLLLETPMSEDQRDFARTIRASGETLLEIINDILDYSKADVGKLEIEQQVFDLRRCVEDSLDLVTPRALEKRLNLAYMIEDGTPESLVGDPTRIRQILVNLLSNAVKFTHQGEVFVSVDSEPHAHDVHRIRFAVQDSGIGIAPEHLPRLFQSFSQVDASTTRKYGGTGLGLAISKRLAELMGGTVSVQSEPGQGSLFQVTLLARLARSDAAPDFLQRNVPALAGKRLLIVDDNLTNRRILTRMALLWGMLPSTLPSALEALDRIHHGERFDIAVLDMSMPGIDGLELAAGIRRQLSAAELPIVMLTSLGQRQALQEEHGAELAAYLSKPIKASQLFATLLSVVMGQRSAPPPPPMPENTMPMPLEGLPLRVLVAEDNAVNQRVAVRLLQRLGYRADVAANGLEVLDAVERQDYDVVLMDIQMPEMDGLQAARWIVQRRGPGGLPRIVAMTANAMPGDREAYLAAGMDGYVAKPIDLEDLAAAMTGVALRSLTASPPVVRDAVRDTVLDTTRLDHLDSMQDDSQPGLVCEVIDMFLCDAPGHLQALGEAMEVKDAERMRRAAHRFLSATQNIGAHNMSGMCIEIELQCRAGDMDGVSRVLAELARESERVSVALKLERLRFWTPPC